MTDYTEEEINRWKYIEEVATKAQEFYNKVCVFGEESFAKVLADDFNEALKSIAPITYCGLTEEEWQRVLDGGFDIREIGYRTWFNADAVLIDQITEEVTKFEWRQEIGHRQPYFPRLGKPVINTGTKILIKEHGEWVTPISSNYDWSDVTEFIQLTEGSTND